MIVEYVRYELPDEEGDALRAKYQEAGPILSADSHCLDWELRRGVEDPSRHVVRITWDSQEGHEDGFRTTPAYQDFLNLLGPFRQFVKEMGHYEIVAERETAT